MAQNNFIYITFLHMSYQTLWFILCNEDGQPITNIDKAMMYCRAFLSESKWGIATYNQMLLGNAERDNF